MGENLQATSNPQTYKRSLSTCWSKPLTKIVWDVGEKYVSGSRAFDFGLRVIWIRSVFSQWITCLGALLAS